MLINCYGGDKLSEVKKYWWVGLLLVLIPAVARADGMVIYSPLRPVYETGQKAVIRHDGKRETMILSTTFKGNADDFAWVIPVPTKPEVNQGKDELFTALDDYTRPKYERNVPIPMMGIGSLTSDVSMKGQTVTVLETKKIDIYDVTVLEATDGKALSEWLTKNGYEYPANRGYLLQYYIDKNWYFVAAKVTTDALGYVGSGLREGHATPLSISFDWPTIIYPLKISGPGSKYNEANIIGAFGFEEGLEGWYGGIVVRNEAMQGSMSLRLGSSNFDYSAEPTGVIFTPHNSIGTRSVSGLKKGTDYVFSAYLKAKPGTKGQAKIRVSMAGAEEFSDMTDLTQASDWKRLAVKFRPFSDNSVTFNLMTMNVTDNTPVYWDEVQIEKGSTPSAFVDEVLPKDQAQTNTYQSTGITLYVLANHKKTVPGFTTDYAGNIPAKDIEKLAVNDDGSPWMKTTKKMYLTKLSRYMNQAQMIDDLIIRDANDNTTVGSGKEAATGWVRPVLVFAVLICLEAAAGIIWYTKKRKA